MDEVCTKQLILCNKALARDIEASDHAIPPDVMGIRIHTGAEETMKNAVVKHPEDETELQALYRDWYHSGGWRRLAADVEDITGLAFNQTLLSPNFIFGVDAGIMFAF